MISLSHVLRLQELRILWSHTLADTPEDCACVQNALQMHLHFLRGLIDEELAELQPEVEVAHEEG